MKHVTNILFACMLAGAPAWAQDSDQDEVQRLRRELREMRAAVQELRSELREMRRERQQEEREEAREERSEAREKKRGEATQPHVFRVTPGEGGRFLVQPGGEGHGVMHLELQGLDEKIQKALEKVPHDMEGLHEKIQEALKKAGVGKGGHFVLPHMEFHGDGKHFTIEPKGAQPFVFEIGEGDHGDAHGVWVEEDEGDAHGVWIQGDKGTHILRVKPAEKGEKAEQGTPRIYRLKKDDGSHGIIVIQGGKDGEHDVRVELDGGLRIGDLESPDVQGWIELKADHDGEALPQVKRLKVAPKPAPKKIRIDI